MNRSNAPNTRHHIQPVSPKTPNNESNENHKNRDIGNNHIVMHIDISNNCQQSCFRHLCDQRISRISDLTKQGFCHLFSPFTPPFVVELGIPSNSLSTCYKQNFLSICIVPIKRKTIFSKINHLNMPFMTMMTQADRFSARRFPPPCSLSAIR